MIFEYVFMLKSYETLKPNVKHLTHCFLLRSKGVRRRVSLEGAYS